MFLISHLVAPFLQLSHCESHNTGETCKGDDSCFWNEIWYWFDSFSWFTWIFYVIQSPSYASFVLWFSSWLVSWERKITGGRETWSFTSFHYTNYYLPSSPCSLCWLLILFNEGLFIFWVLDFNNVCLNATYSCYLTITFQH